MTTKVQSIIAVDSDVGAGAATWWRLTTVSYQDLKDELKAIAWPDRLMPVVIADNTALKRALDFDMKVPGCKFQIIPLDGGAYAVEQTVVSGTDVRHEKVFKVLVNEHGTLHFWEHLGNEALCNKVETGYLRWRGRLDGYDVGMWLSTKVVPHLMGLTLRDRGGIYYIPPTTLPAYRQVSDVLGRLGGGTVFELPAMECDKAVTAILDAVQQEAAEAAERMERELEGALGSTALKNRVGRCDRVLEKVAAYETMLGTSLDGIRARMETLSATIAAAILTADAEADAADAAVAA